MTGLERDRDELTAQLAAAQSALGSAGPSETIPPLGVALLAILGGACAGFAMAWLGMRRDPVAIEPATHVAGRPAPTA